jgi:hypothetical protein
LLPSAIGPWYLKAVSRFTVPDSGLGEV